MEKLNGFTATYNPAAGKDHSVLAIGFQYAGESHSIPIKVNDGDTITDLEDALYEAAMKLGEIRRQAEWREEEQYYTFIGGHAHGTRNLVKNKHSVVQKADMIQGDPFSLGRGAVYEIAKIKVEHYRKTRWIVGEKEVQPYFVLASLSDEEAADKIRAFILEKAQNDLLERKRRIIEENQSRLIFRGVR